IGDVRLDLRASELLEVDAQVPLLLLKGKPFVAFTLIDGLQAVCLRKLIEPVVELRIIIVDEQDGGTRLDVRKQLVEIAVGLLSFSVDLRHEIDHREKIGAEVLGVSLPCPVAGHIEWMEDRRDAEAGIDLVIHVTPRLSPGGIAVKDLAFQLRFLPLEHAVLQNAEEIAARPTANAGQDKLGAADQRGEVPRPPTDRVDQVGMRGGVSVDVRKARRRIAVIQASSSQQLLVLRGQLLQRRGNGGVLLGLRAGDGLVSLVENGLDELEYVHGVAFVVHSIRSASRSGSMTP